MKITSLTRKIKRIEAKMDKIDEKKLNREMYNLLEAKKERASTAILEKYGIAGLKQKIADIKKEREKTDYRDEKYAELEEKKKGVLKDLLDKLKDASVDEKLVAGEYLHGERIMIGGCGTFGYFKDPSTCGSCVEGRGVLGFLGLREFAEYKGERCHDIPEERKQQALEALLSEEDLEELAVKKKKLEEAKDKLADLTEERKELGKKKDAFKRLKKVEVDYEKVEENMPDFIQAIMDTKANFATAEPDQGVGVILENKSHYYGTGGCEYGVNVIVMRDGDKAEKYFKWRDPYNSRKDRPELDFDKAKIMKVDNQGIEVKLISEDYEKEEWFPLLKKKKAKRKAKAALSKEEQKAWKKKYQSQKEELMKKHFREKGMMPDYINFKYSGGPPGITTGEMVSYERPSVVDEFVDQRTGKAAVIIKAQIDHCAAHGKQHEWVGYVINKKGEAKQVYRVCAYEIQLREGKRIEQKAKDLLK